MKRKLLNEDTYLMWVVHHNVRASIMLEQYFEKHSKEVAL